MDESAEKQISLSVNGRNRTLEGDTDRTLLEVLREDLDLTGAKLACDDGECGSCIVMMGTKPVKACLLAAKRARGKSVTTIEGLAAQATSDSEAAMGEGADDAFGALENSPALHPLQQAFLEKGATQCGFCIPGMIMRANALLISNNNPSYDEVAKSLSKNLCRCTGYTKIIEAVLYAAEMMRTNEPRSQARQGQSKERSVGQSVPRLDSPATVTGEAKYAADLKRPGMLHARMLRSPHHHARILSIDTAPALAMEGVEAVITADDVPGTPYLPNCQPQVHVFPRDKVRFKGEAIAAVAAVSDAVAERALEAIKVQYEPLESVIELEDAAAPSAPRVFDHAPNVSEPQEVVQGDVDAGFAKADVIVENTYRVPVREHAAMEPEAALAYEDESGVVTIETPLYHPFVQGQRSIANNLAISPDKVRIVCPAMGGNFGTRGDTLHAVVAALLSRKCDRPVRLVMPRSESILGSCKAPSVVMRYRTGATRDGRLVALDAEILHGAGSWAPFLVPTTTQGAELCYFETLAALLSHATGPYLVENVRARATDVLTNAPRFVPLRGTNANYLPLAYESQMDQLAEQLGIDPLEFRLKNAIEVGARTHVGQQLNESVNIKAELERLKPWYAEARQRLLSARNGENGSAEWQRGVGIGCGWRNIGYVNTTVTAGAELLKDGRVLVLAGTVEQGQGPTTQFAQIASDELRVPIDQLAVRIGDTGEAPYPVPTFSSITTVATGKAVQDASRALREAITAEAAAMLGCAAQDVQVEGGVVVARDGRKIELAEIAERLDQSGSPTRYEGEVEWKGETPNILYGYNAGLIEAEVNKNTGEIRLLNHVNVCDPGQQVNPLALEGQVDGGIAFGIGFALKERFHPDNKPNFESYGLPTTRDIARKVTRLYVEEPLSRGPFGAKSMAEHPGISPIPAIIGAIHSAVGVRMTEIPATADRVKAKLSDGHAA